MNVTARAVRESGWWTVTVDEVPGLFTQTRRLDQIPAMVRDALALFPEITTNPAEATVDVVPEGETAQRASAAADLRDEARKMQAEATATLQSAASELSQRGLTYRDIGTLLGVSYQQAQKLAAAAGGVRQATPQH